MSPSEIPDFLSQVCAFEETCVRRGRVGLVDNGRRTNLTGVAEKTSAVQNMTYAFTIVAVLVATTVWAGETVGAATEIPEYFMWHVQNFTDQTLAVGEFYKQQGDNSSSITFGRSYRHEPMAPGEHESTSQPYDEWDTSRLYTWGRVCYAHRWWNLRRDSPRYHWDNVYLYAVDDEYGLGKRLIANPDGAHEDVPLVVTDAC